MASLTMNGTSLRSPSSLSEGSEESFVVLSRSVDPETPEQLPSEHSSLLTSSIVYPTIPQVPVTDAVSQATSIMSTSVTSELSAEEIQSKLESLLEENLQLKATLQQNNLAMKKQFSTLVMWQEDVMKVHQSHKEKFEETKKLIANLRAENGELKKCASLPAPTTNYKSEEETLNLKSKISALEFELDTLRQGNIKFKNEQSKIIHELEVKLSESEKSKDEEITKLSIQIDSLNTQLHTMEQQFTAVQYKLADALGKIPSAEEVEVSENAIRQLKEIASELVLKNKILKEKTDLIDNLHEEISKLKIDNETIPILRTQVDVYQSDFNQEREARNELKTERDRIAEDLNNLQRRNQKLLEEVEHLRQENRFVHVQVPAASQQSPRQSASREIVGPPKKICRSYICTENKPRETSSYLRSQSSTSSLQTEIYDLQIFFGGPTQSPSLAQFICPVCSNNFPTLRSLEGHIDACIQNSA